MKVVYLARGVCWFQNLEVSPLVLVVGSSRFLCLGSRLSNQLARVAENPCSACVFERMIVKRITPDMPERIVLPMSHQKAL
jgi:hypothetical protein